jgi:hypothetical protein
LTVARDFLAVDDKNSISGRYYFFIPISESATTTGTNPQPLLSLLLLSISLDGDLDPSHTLQDVNPSLPPFVCALHKLQPKLSKIWIKFCTPSLSLTSLMTGSSDKVAFLKFYFVLSYSPFRTDTTATSFSNSSLSCLWWHVDLQQDPHGQNHQTRG